uniref:Uncharacterized protein n=1 Tax=Anguilla anguilla TaxID=7936 RepID=A0A0E9U6N6_ANGAN
MMLILNYYYMHGSVVIIIAYNMATVIAAS